MWVLNTAMALLLRGTGKHGARNGNRHKPQTGSGCTTKNLLRRLSLTHRGTELMSDVLAAEVLAAEISVSRKAAARPQA